MHINFATFVVLLISGANLCGLAFALLLNEQHEPGIKLPLAAELSMMMAFLSQALYLVFLAAWQFRWVRFYPGAPVYRIVPVGLVLSFFGLVIAFFGIGPKRWISFMVSITTAVLWLLAAVVSVAV
jgi:hypothetical protein